MSSIGLCMIVKNEGTYLGACLESVKDLVDEIVIVDTGSTDNTMKIAATFGAKIVKIPWTNDFAAARNAGLSHVTANWVLQLDADEVLAYTDAFNVVEAVRNAQQNTVAFRLILRNYSNDSSAAGWKSSSFDSYNESTKATGWWEVPKIRLFKNNVGIQYEGVVHETLYGSASRVGVVEALRIPIHHYGKLDIGREASKKQLYEQLGKTKMEENNDYYSYYELGRQYAQSGKWEEAIITLKQALALKEDHFESLFLLGSAYVQLRQDSCALEEFKKAHRINSEYGPLHVNLGIAISAKDPARASLHFEKAIKLDSNNAAAYKNLAISYNKLGMEKKAQQAMHMAVKLNPKYGQ